MVKKKITKEEVAVLTRKLFHLYYSGNLEPWFSYLCTDSVYIGTGEPIFVNPFTILYVQSHGKKTELICVDRIIHCNSSIGALAKELPAVFYQIHRGYLVNTRYITAIRRFEVELLLGITLPIPALTYMQVKQDLQAMLQA